jgi:hypothetical protein
MIRAIGILFLACFTASATLAQVCTHVDMRIVDDLRDEATGTIELIVLNEQGTGLPAIRFSLSSETKDFQKTSTTNARGTVTLRGLLPSPDYLLQISYPLNCTCIMRCIEVDRYRITRLTATVHTPCARIDDTGLIIKRNGLGFPDEEIERLPVTHELHLSFPRITSVPTGL